MEDKDWSESEKADELREYIDKFFKPRRTGMKHLDRELIIDFVAKQIEKDSPKNTK